MNIFITGGSGFIGHNVARMLQNVHRVTTFDNETNYGIIPEDEIASLHKERQALLDKCSIVKGDIRHRAEVYAAIGIARPDVVIHLASFPRAKVVNIHPADGADVMSTALMTLLEQCKEHNVKRFVYISSSMVYGDFSNGVSEDAQCKPQGTYGILKYAGELLVKDYCKANDIDYVIVRPSAVYGPRDVEDRVVSKFLMNAIRGDDIVVKGASEVLDFTYVDDIAAGIVLAATNEKAVNDVFNMTYGEGLTLLGAANAAVAITQSNSKIVVTGKDEMFPSRGTLSNVHAIFNIGYTPTTTIEEGVKQYYNWACRK